MSEEFIRAMRENQGAFGLDLGEDSLALLAGYYDLVQEHNPLLHLVAQCSPAEFAIRHVLESLTLLEFLPGKGRIADVGTGAGLPSIPCLLARPNLEGLLIESKEKKAKFLSETVGRLGLGDRVEISNKQFEEVVDVGPATVTCRALDKFVERLSRLIKWSKGREMLLFGGPRLGETIGKLGFTHSQKLMPLSEQRFLFRLPPRARREVPRCPPRNP